MSTFALWLGLMTGVTGFSADRDTVRVRLAGPTAQLIVQADRAIIIGRSGERIGALETPGRVELHFDVGTQGFHLSLRGKGRGLKLPKLNAEFPLRFELSGGRIAGKNIPDHFTVSRELGMIEAVAKLPFADYLVGVLHREMPGRWPLEALKAQAVATRSYTLAQMKERQGHTYDLDASVMDQEFEFVPVANRKTEIFKRWGEALKKTDSVVLLSKAGGILKAYYHADCGGRTTTPDFVWGPQGDYKSVRDPACEKRSQNQWQMVAKKSWLREKLGGVMVPALRSPAKAQTLRLDWIQSLFDQRVTLVEWWDGFGDMQILSGQNFRQILGFGELRSLKFESRDLGDAVEFKGRGFGHGVGLCQWGSKDWAEQGQSSEQILRHYYPLARLGRK